MTRIVVAACVAAFIACGSRAQEAAQLDTSFASRVERLSEPGGYFDTDNLISNERSYLHVVAELQDLGVSGGAYIGVGPDQNFSYIAQIRPHIAFIIDIRRDNMLLHLMFKALFELAANRIEYLSLLFARPPPSGLGNWDAADIARLVAYVDSTPTSEKVLEAVRGRVDSVIGRFGVPLAADDWATIDRFHRTFINAGPSLRFHSTGRAPQFYYPTYRQLLLETDRSGREASYLVREADFQCLKRIQERGLVIPVVGDLSGEHALQAIGRFIAGRGERVSAFYTSNVEFYLFRSGSFGRFVENVEALPRDDRSVVIRSVFNRAFGGRLPESVPGYYSTQLLQLLDSLVDGYEDGMYRSYRELVTRNARERGHGKGETGKGKGDAPSSVGSAVILSEAKDLKAVD